MEPPGVEMRNITRERCDMNEEKYAASRAYIGPSQRHTMLGGINTGAGSWGRARVYWRFPARATLTGWAVHEGGYMASTNGRGPGAELQESKDASRPCGWMKAGG
jgi:hypothetical protein